jgi:hypothetical protein
MRLKSAPALPSAAPSPLGRSTVAKSELLRRRILASSDPVALAIDVMLGKAFKAARVEGSSRRVTVFPTLDQRIKMMQWLGNKVLPDLKAVELTTNGSESLGHETQVAARKKFLDAIAGLAGEDDS